MVKNLPANARDVRDMGSIPGSGRSLGAGHGNPLQCSGLEKSMGSYRVGHDRVPFSPVEFSSSSQFFQKENQGLTCSPKSLPTTDKCLRS